MLTIEPAPPKMYLLYYNNILLFDVWLFNDYNTGADV